MEGWKWGGGFSKDVCQVMAFSTEVLRWQFSDQQPQDNENKPAGFNPGVRASLLLFLSQALNLAQKRCFSCCCFSWVPFQLRIVLRDAKR